MTRLNSLASKWLPCIFTSLFSYQAFADLQLPMPNYPLQAGAKTLGYTVYPGVRVNPDVTTMSLAVRPTNDLYYVPQLATVEASNRSLSIGANCQAVQTELNSETVLAGVKSSLIQILANNRTLAEQLIIDQSKYTGQCIENTATETVAVEQESTARTRLIEARNTVTRVKGELDTCKLLNGDNCQAEAQLVADAAAALVQAQGNLSAAIESSTAAQVAKSSSCSKSEAAGASVTRLFDTITTTTARIANLEDQVIGRLDAMGLQDGGTATAVISIRAKQQAEELQNANPSLRVRPINIKSATFHFVPNPNTMNPLVSRKTVLGIGVTGAEASPSLPGSTLMNAIDSNGSVGVTLGLSRIGACSPELSASAGFSYDFDTYSYLSGRAEWNKWQTYEKIESTTKKGGFFSSKTVHNLWVDMKNGDGFKFVVANDNGGIDPESMRNELRKALLDQVIKDWAELQSLDATGGMSMPQAGPTGAEVFAEGLSKCPHIYCQGGVYVLKGLQAVFGSAGSRDEIKKEYNTTATEVFSYTQVYPRKAKSATAVIWK